MPVSHGLRSRPSMPNVQKRVSHLVSQQGFIDVVPRAVIFPLLALAMLGFVSATSWVLSLHNTDVVAEIEQPVTTGTVKIQ